MEDNGLPYVDGVGLAAWVAEHTDLPLDVVASVLQVEFEYMIGVGLVSSDPPGAHYELVYYATGELDDVRGTRRFDTDRFTRDAERFTGVGLETIDRIVASEIEYLHLRGIA